MSAFDYHFVSYWPVSGTVEEVSDILSDPLSYPRWWPEVYLGAELLSSGDACGIGAAVQLTTRGKLPYRLCWTARVIESSPFGFTIEASGDFVGHGIWSFVQLGERLEISFDWQIRAEKPLLRRWSWLLKPMFAWNHRWAMQRGELALRKEIARRRNVPRSGGAPDWAETRRLTTEVLRGCHRGTQSSFLRAPL